MAVDTGLTAADPDSATLAGAAMAIGAGFSASTDTLAFVAQNGITGAWNAAAPSDAISQSRSCFESMWA